MFLITFSPRKTCVFSKTGLHRSPLYFVRSGYINLPTGSLWNAGYSGDYWFSSASPADILHAFFLYFHPANISPSASDSRYYGFSLRKLVSMPHPCISSVVAISSSLTTASLWYATPYSVEAQSTFTLGFYPTSTDPADSADRCVGYPLPNIKITKTTTNQVNYKMFISPLPSF